MGMTPEQFDRLPKYARDEIEELRRLTAEAVNRAQEARLATSPSESDTTLDPYAEIPIGLGVGPTIRFTLGNVNYLNCEVRRRRDGRPYLYVRGSDEVHLAPEASNAIRVWVNES